MDLKLDGKVALITGASGGIGRALALEFAAEGARIALHAHTRADEARAWLGQQEWRDRALVVEADVRSTTELEAAFNQVLEHWQRIDVCIANAGVWPPENAGLHEVPEERFRRVVETNFLGAAWTARSFLAALARTGPRDDGHGASLTFIGSTAGRFGERGHADYAASKSALYGLVRSLKHEIVDLDPYGRVNLVEPGWTVTHMARPALDEPGAIRRVARTMPLKQLARAKDIARTAVWLASPTAARHVTGEILTVAGGMEGRVRWEPEEIDEDAIRKRLLEE